MDLAVVPDPKAWLEARLARLGPVKWCTVDEDEPPPEPPSPPPPEPAVAVPATATPEEDLEEELEDGPEPEALDLPFEVVSALPPQLLRRIAERAGGRAPPRVLVLGLPLTADPGPPGSDAGVVAARAEGFRRFATEFLALADPPPPLLG